LIILNTVAVSTVFQPEANGLMWNVLGTGKVWLFFFITPLVILSIDSIYKIFSDILFPNADTKFTVALYSYLEKQSQILKSRKSIEVSPQNVSNSVSHSYRRHSDDQIEELEYEEPNSSRISPSNIILAKPRTHTFRENEGGDIGGSKYIVGEENESQSADLSSSHGPKIRQPSLKKIIESEGKEPESDSKSSDSLPSTERKNPEFLPAISRSS
jgi:hypothetical protein